MSNKIPAHRKTIEMLSDDKAMFEAMFEAMFNSTPDAVIFADTERRIVMNNPAVHKMFGYTDEELIGQTTEMLYADKQDFEDQGHRRYRTGPDTETTPYEVRYKHKDGTVFWTETLGTQVKDTNGTIIGFIGMFRDITERKQFEVALQESEERFKAQYMGIPFPTYTWQQQGDEFVLVDVNEAAKTYTHGEVNKLLGSTIRELYADMPQVIEDFLRCFTNKCPVNSEGLVRLISTGEEKYLNITYFFVPPDIVMVHTEDITERKQSEEALRESENKFRQAFENAALGISIVGLKGQFIQVNHYMCQLLGYSEAELLSMSFNDVTHPDNLQIGLDKLHQMLSGEINNAWFEKRYVHKLGQTVWVMLSTNLLRNEHGEPLYFVTQTQDITKRKQSEAKLCASESLLNEAQRLSHLGSWDLNLATGKAIWSEELYRLLGYEPYAIEASSGNFLARIHPEDKAYAMRELERPFQEKNQEYRAEFRIVQPDKRVRIVAEHGRLIYDEQGKAQRYVGTTLDITERKQAEEKIRASEKELSDILNSLQDTYYRVDNEGHLDRVSSSVKQLLGYSPEQLAGTKLADLYVEPKGWEKFLAEIKERNGTIENYETQLKHRNGSTVWVSNSAHYLRDEQGAPTGIEGISRDISQLKSTEDLRSRFGRILDNSTNEIYVFDAESMHFTQVNRGARQNLGYAMRELKLLTPLDIKPDFTRESFDDLVKPLRQGTQEQVIFQTRHQRKDGSLYPVEVRLQLSRNESPPVFLSFIMDITERTQIEEQLQYMAHYDALTDLPNRVLFTDRLSQSLTHADRHNRLVAVLFMDLDRFKLINDTMGHDFGDRALQALAGRLNKCVRAGDTVARLGGDEFAVVLDDIASADDVVHIARKILDVLSQSFLLDEREFFITTSIGISLFPMDGKDTQTLLKHADIAMYRSKDQGRNTYQFYSSDMSAKTLERLSMETSLRHALEREEFVLYYQPQIDLLSNRVTGVEALLRWQHPDLGLIMPAEFVPILEDTGLIIPVGEWVLHNACLQARAWNDTELKPLRIAVNLSSRQFNEPKFIDMIERTLKDTELKPSLLELEMTESILMQDVGTTISTLNTINDMGIRLAVDDFGTGYSSLSYLKRFPIDTLKIDRSFIRDIIQDPDDATLVEAIIALGRALHLNIIAEGVETEAQVNFLKSHNCDCVQGYLFYSPQAAQDLEKQLRKK